jgi:hypothetical protein
MKPFFYRALLVPIAVIVFAAVIYFIPDATSQDAAAHNIRCFSGGKMIYAASAVKNLRHEYGRFVFELNTQHMPTITVRAECIAERVTR